MSTENANFFTVNNVETRPNAKDGLWVLSLLPLSLITSTLKYPIVLTPTYKLTSILSFGLLLTSAAIAFQKYKKRRLKIVDRWTILAFILTSSLFHICLHKGWLFCVLSGYTSTLLYFKAYIFVLEKFAKCFSLGEAGLIVQSVIILLYCTILNIFNFSHVPKTNMQIATLIIQIGLLGIGIISASVYHFRIRTTKSFYVLSHFVVCFMIFLPLHTLLGRSPILWIINSILGDTPTLKLVIYWSFCTGIAVLAVSNQIVHARKASSGMRKVFHILALVVYIPGLFYKCSFLYLASGIVLGIFIVLEILRILNIPPLGVHLQDGFAVFSDEKDTGILALTPIYLLAGCSLPLWIHPAPCDVTDSAMFNLTPLLSGLLSIGVGDTAASIVGSNYGKHFWTGSKKTIEGTVACVLSQIGLIYLLVYFGYLEHLSLSNAIKLYIAIVVGSFVEAKTTQVDNLVLPLIMYIILS